MTSPLTLSTQQRIGQLERRKTWIHRGSWIWLFVAFYLFWTRANMPNMGYAIADLVATIGPLTFGSFYCFFVIDGDIHRLHMESLTRRLER